MPRLTQRIRRPQKNGKVKIRSFLTQQNSRTETQGHHTPSQPLHTRLYLLTLARLFASRPLAVLMHISYVVRVQQSGTEPQNRVRVGFDASREWGLNEKLSVEKSLGPKAVRIGRHGSRPEPNSNTKKKGFPGRASRASVDLALGVFEPSFSCCSARLVCRVECRADRSPVRRVGTRGYAKRNAGS